MDRDPGIVIKEDSVHVLASDQVPDSTCRLDQVFRQEQGGQNPHRSPSSTGDARPHAAPMLDNHIIQIGTDGRVTGSSVVDNAGSNSLASNSSSVSDQQNRQIVTRSRHGISKPKVYTDGTI
jgi:hypothetical protein